MSGNKGKTTTNDDIKSERMEVIMDNETQLDATLARIEAREKVQKDFETIVSILENGNREQLTKKVINHLRSKGELDN